MLARTKEKKVMGKYCPKCGAEVTEGTKFCKQCGALVENKSQVTNKVVNV